MVNYNEFEIPDTVSLVNNDNDDVLEPVIVSPSLMDQLPPNFTSTPCLDVSEGMKKHCIWVRMPLVFDLVFVSVCV